MHRDNLQGPHTYIPPFSSIRALVVNCYFVLAAINLRSLAEEHAGPLLHKGGRLMYKLRVCCGFSNRSGF